MSDESWIKFFPSKFRHGVEALTAEERGVYVSLLMLIFERGAPIPRDDRRLAHMCGASPTRFRRVLQDLIAAHKIIMDGDGNLSNARARQTLIEREKKSKNAQRSANKRHARPQSVFAIDDEQNQQHSSANACLSQPVRSPPSMPNASSTLARDKKDIDSSLRSESITPLASLAPPIKKPKPKSEGCTIDPDARPTEDEISMAFEKCGLVNGALAAQWEKFVAYHLKKQTRIKNRLWTWRSWLANVKDFSPRRNDNGRRSLAEVANGVADRLEQDDFWSVRSPARGAPRREDAWLLSGPRDE